MMFMMDFENLNPNVNSCPKPLESRESRESRTFLRDSTLFAHERWDQTVGPTGPLSRTLTDSTDLTDAVSSFAVLPRKTRQTKKMPWSSSMEK